MEKQKPRDGIYESCPVALDKVAAKDMKLVIADFSP